MIETLHDRLSDENDSDNPDSPAPVATLLLIAVLFVGIWLIGASVNAGFSVSGRAG